ncbi:hypothetical protein diail_5083 [Diaporthe ilicicola]|nr:hypothetical protein diail_5083 [Diaporthe ilicicola]
MDDADGSTTPPLPPSESLETQLQQEPSRSPPVSVQLKHQREEQGHDGEHGETCGKEARTDASPHQSRLPRPANSRTPEPRIITLSNPHTNGRHRSQANGHGHVAGLTHAAHLAPERSATPDTPGTARSIASFDWEDLDARFETALADANQQEHALLAEFEALVMVCNQSRLRPLVRDPTNTSAVFQCLGLRGICPRQ